MNLDFRHFYIDRHAEVDLDKLRFFVFDFLTAGESYLAELDVLKAKSKQAAPSFEALPEKMMLMRERDWAAKGRTLRERDPW